MINKGGEEQTPPTGKYNWHHGGLKICELDRTINKQINNLENLGQKDSRRRKSIYKRYNYVQKIIEQSTNHFKLSYSNISDNDLIMETLVIRIQHDRILLK